MNEANSTPIYIYIYSFNDPPKCKADCDIFSSSIIETIVLLENIKLSLMDVSLQNQRYCFVYIGIEVEKYQGLCKKRKKEKENIATLLVQLGEQP